ncbi:MAG: protein tyrosine phosphatase family protein [Cellvibrionaceae bacterium]
MKEITNFFQITESIATSGQPTKDQFKMIKEAGYQTVINLAMPDSDHAIPNEAELTTLLGMNYFHIPVPFDAPNHNHLQLFSELLNSLEISGFSKVWVHCVVNARVSAFMFQYLTQIKGILPEDAESPILKKWRLNMDDTWKGFLKLAIE